MPSDEELQVLDVKLKQLKLDYEQYFLGSRPREPAQLRGEVQKLFTLYSQTPIPNTSVRFRFNSLMSRFLAFRRHWDETLRKIEDGTYARQVFKADLHDRERRKANATASSRVRGPEEGATAGSKATSDLFESWREACRSTGQELAGMTREKLDAVLDRQRAALQSQYGCSEVNFRVVVESGRARLKATPVGVTRPRT